MPALSPSSTPPSFAERALASVDQRLLRRYAPSPSPRTEPDFVDLCRRALADPVGTAPLAELADAAGSIAVVISDASRDEPRAAMLEALFEVLPRERCRLVVASGTHRGATADVVPIGFRDRPVAVHDATSDDACVDLGTTAEGTRVRVLREVAEADLVVVTGRVRPHYFAGYSGGTKGIFPGCALAEDALRNHLLKADATARLGRVDDNRCRRDMEEAAAKVAGSIFVLNVLADVDGRPVAAAAGDRLAAHRHLVGHAERLFVVSVPRASVVVVADRPPVARSLYQASKLLPPAGPVLEPGGTVILVAECDEGIEPVERVNDGIYRLGIRVQLPEHRVLLVSALSADVVRRSYAEPSASLGVALAESGVSPDEPAVALWRAGEAIVREV